MFCWQNWFFKPDARQLSCIVSGKFNKEAKIEYNNQDTHIVNNYYSFFIEDNK